jgi:hypothetical protein
MITLKQQQCYKTKVLRKDHTMKIEKIKTNHNLKSLMYHELILFMYDLYFFYIYIHIYSYTHILYFMNIIIYIKYKILL